ncbi:amidohydrolase [Microcella humidisoli]|uniref:Amidohydrolase n=1 Tax=Microcella humidisoli TaxID=2963406 RepID=A0ABY5FY86_9MICO|nr:amidohydrolase [Microcella humidisoli]UTT63280.1 amidohydrolase [Microcella humidisoli]
MCLACDWAEYVKKQDAREAWITRRPSSDDPARLDGRPDALARASGEHIVFRNGVVYTAVAGASIESAVVIDHGEIIYVGDDEGASAFEDSSARVVDLDGRMLLPGFVEAHIHPIVGSTITRGVDLQFDTLDETLAALRSYKDEIGAVDIVRGFGWRYTAFPPTGPVKADLDAIWPDTPVVLFAIDGHSAWANSRALELAGVTRDAPDPNPGFSFFQRDESGEPTGWLVEVAAIFSVLMPIAPYTGEYIVDALADWMPKASAAGITSLFDAGIILIPEEEGFEIYSDFERRGALPFRLVGSFYHFDPAVDPVPIITGLRDRFATELVSARVLKINIDGGDAQRTAAMLEPYSDDPSTSGDTILPIDVLNETVLRADLEGLDLHFHSFGDRGIRVTLDALEKAISANPPRDRRHTMAHLVVVNDADLPRFAELGVIGQFTSQWAVPDAFWNGVTRERWGDERANSTYRFGTHLRTGARLTLGTDWPAASHYSTYEPLKAIQIAVTRQELGREDSTEPLTPADERITLDEALRANTIDAAFQLRLDDTVGTIEVGKRADLIVLDKNLFDLPPAQISSARVVLTLMDGVIRHQEL